MSNAVQADGVMKIVIVQDAGLGDFVLLLPVLAALRAGFPGCSLKVHSPYGMLATECGLADSALGVPLWKAKDSPDISRMTAELLADADLVVTYIGNRGRYEASFATATQGRVIHCPGRPDPEMPAARFFLQALQPLGIPIDNEVPVLYFAGVAESNQIAICPTASARPKMWPPELWAKALMALNERVLICGELMDVLALSGIGGSLAKEKTEVLIGKPLVEYARRVQGCRFWVGHDSGSMHLAAALGLPGIVLRNETPETRPWRQVSEKIVTIPMMTPVDQLVSAIKSALA